LRFVRSSRKAGEALRLRRLAVLLLAAGIPACRHRLDQVSRLPAPPEEVEWLKAGSDTRPGIWLSAGDAISWDVPAGPARRLSGAYESSLAGASPGSLEVSLSSPGRAAASPFWQDGLPAVSEAGRWRAFSIDVPPTREPVRLSLSYRHPKPDAASHALFVTEPALLASRRGRPRTVVLFLVDTLRADRVSAGDADRPTTPRIDAWFEQGFRVETCLPAGNWTLPSHASLLTSTSVARHGVGRYGQVLPRELETLAGALAASGYRTLAVTGGGYVDASFGFARGFDRYTVSPGRAALAVESALSMLAEHRDEPVFLFLHTYQVHDYAPDEAAAKKLFPDLSVMGPDWRDSIGLLTRSRLSDPRLTGWIRARYDAALRSVDDAFGLLLDGLRAQGRIDETGVVLTSDHGEAMCDRTFRGDCLEWGHGSPYLFEEELEVPLLARFPWHPSAGRRVAGVASLLDVAPTILAAADIAAPSSFEGRSLLSAAAPEGRWAVTEAPPHDAVAVREGSRKLIRRTGVPQKSLFDPAASYYRMPVEECFDLASDPREKRPRACDEPSGAGLSERADRYIASSFAGSLVLRIPPRPEGEGRRPARVRVRGRASAPGIRTFGLASPAELSQEGAAAEARFGVALGPAWIAIEPSDDSQSVEIETEGLGPLVTPAGLALSPGEHRWRELLWPAGRELPPGVALFTTPPAPRASSAVPALSSEVAARLMSLGYLGGAPVLSGKIDPAASSSIAGAADLSPGQVRVLRAN
jgi:arylsulfatase A-like enzyme